MLKELGLSFYFFRNFSIGVGEMEKLVYEEYLNNLPAPVCVFLFLSDREREVEDYWARFPDCSSGPTSQENVPIRSFVTAVAAWAEKWTLALCVNIFSQHEAMIRNIALASSIQTCLLYTSPSPRDRTRSRMPSSA